MIEENKKLVAKVLALMEEVKWEETFVVFDIGQISMSLYLEFTNETGKKRINLSTKEFKFYLSPLRVLDKSVRQNEKERFNTKIVTIKPDGSFTEKYWWDEEKDKQAEQAEAIYFHHSIHEHLCQRFYEYELENGLLSTYIDGDGEEMYEDPSWFDGIFTFRIHGGQLFLPKIILIKDGKERTLDYPFPDYLLETFFSHYERLSLIHI